MLYRCYWVSALSSTWGQINRWHLWACKCACVWDWQSGELSDLQFLSADRSQLLPLLPTRKGRLYSQILIYAQPRSNFYLGAPCWTPFSSGLLFMNLLKDWFAVIHWLVTFYWECNELTKWNLFLHFSYVYAFYTVSLSYFISPILIWH